MLFGEHILPYKKQILRDLKELVRIPSVVSSPLPGKPFGEESARALQTILKMAGSLGLETKNVGNYAGHAVYGQGSDFADVLCHVDVVPAGDGWETEPFDTTEKDGQLYGRGTADDKGAAVVALYCLKALQDAGVKTKRRIRVIFGAGEEVASNDIATYYASEHLPVFGFTPDSDYGICNREKGILRLDFSGGDDSTAVRLFTAGDVVNAVPAKAETVVVCSEEQANAFLEMTEDADNFRCTRTPDGVCIDSEGVASHAMQPQEGVNAAEKLILLLADVLNKEELGSLLCFLDEKVKNEYNGATAGIQQSDEPSGPLTLNLGLVRIGEGTPSAGIDIRYPVTASGDDIFAQMQRISAPYGLTCVRTCENVPLYLPEDSELIRLLKGSYAAVMGEEPTVYATGGGTYARELEGRGVAFGPFFPDEPDRRLHNTNESIDLARFEQHAQICMQAMYDMAVK
ncbi:MAG: Sapep family Mn(2+)-dependent dipeptidase [Oscillospiraceae bacterium]|jgi:succinyl-diaminopimelate desuccinylase|nr:Sapep family Mn(2+)-dependent dipeptidase [Oscillospiraceae bacterium]